MAPAARGVYLTYAERDAAFARRLEASLQAQGIPISATLLRDDVQLLVVYSRAAAGSARVENDVAQAQITGQPVFTLLYGAAYPPVSLIASTVIRFGGEGGYEEAVDQLVRALRPPDTAVPRPSPGPPAPVLSEPAARYEADQPAASAAPNWDSPTGAHPVPRSTGEPAYQARPLLLSRAFSLVSLLAAAGRLLARFRPALPRETAPAALRTDNVHFSVTTHTPLAPGRDSELIVWVHLAEHEPLIVAKAMAALGIHALHRMLFRSAGPAPVARGTVLTLTLSAERIHIAKPTHRLVWTGDAGNANFVLSVPGDAEEGTRRASCAIGAGGFEIARLDFVLTIGRARRHRDTIPARLTAYRTAFASYASEDRDAVLMTVRGMQKIAPSLDVFVDVMSLRSNEDWQERIAAAIASSEVFYLFWCSHAAHSEWVGREWRYALETKGLDFINPVPLQAPDIAPPPEELKAHKHFNDPVLAFVRQHTL